MAKTLMVLNLRKIIHPLQGKKIKDLMKLKIATQKDT